MDKEQQAKLLTGIMEADQKNGLYDIPGVEKFVPKKLWKTEVRDSAKQDSAIDEGLTEVPTSRPKKNLPPK